MGGDDADDLFAPEDDEVAVIAAAPLVAAAPVLPWPVLVVDDDEEVHIMTRLVLGKLRYKDRPLELLTARSGREADALFRTRDDIAVALLDIVMETDDAGLLLARRIREDFGNNDVRIILRTGQPGQAPIRDVIVNYDINDYKSKTELTSEKLFITIITGLRSYDNIHSARMAESASRLKSSFLATMSHEIRTPMNGVLGMLELLSHTTLTSDQQEMLDTARDSAGALLHIIDDILDFSKIEAGRMDIDRHPVDVAAIIENVADTLALNARRKGLRFHIHADPAIPTGLMGDAVRLRQVLFNLTGNAVKFTENGGVTVRADRMTDAPDGMVRIRVAVSDTGIGIPPDLQAKLFEPFIQAERSTSRRFGGTGLGLSISRRLVELMKGRIGLDSVAGEGSTFWFLLDMEPGVQFGTETPAAPLAGLTVTLDVDEPALAETLAVYLRQAGADIAADRAGANILVRSAGSGQDWPHPDEQLPTVLIVDADSRRPDGLSSAVSLVARPVRRSALFRALALAAGRDVARPETAEVTHALTRAPDRETAIATGRLILVAEDQAVNQMVIRRQLGLLGFACDIEADGAAALAAWRPGEHSLLLTDCNMPGMDGYELTAAIRAQEQSRSLPRLPIIALTANAMAGEDQRCINAGMDDFLSKPLNLKQLDSCLHHWLSPGPAPSADLGCEPQEKGAIFDPSFTLELFGTLDDDARAFLAEFTRSLHDLQAKVADAFAQEDWVQAKAQVHGLAGVAKNGGAAALGQLADGVELALAQGEHARAASDAEQIQDMIDRVVAVVAAL